MTTERALEIERRLHEDAELHIDVSEDEGRIILTGIVSGEDERNTALDIVNTVAPGTAVEDNLELDDVLPSTFDHGAVGDHVRGEITETSLEGLQESESLEAGDFTDQETMKYGDSAAGPTSTLDDDPAASGDEVFVPPTDPVGTDREVIGGLQTSSMDDEEIERSSDGTIGDEAVRDMILREWREDAATTDLEIDAEVLNGRATLRGHVPYLVDAENAEAVAARVPGVREVDEQLDIDELE